MEIGLFGLRANQMILENDIPCNFLLDWDYFSWGGVLLWAIKLYASLRGMVFNRFDMQ